MNIVCGFLDHLLYYFPELKHFECFSQDTVSCMLRQNSVYCYLFTCTIVHTYVIFNDRPVHRGVRGGLTEPPFCSLKLILSLNNKY